jgi:hypothetical protein
MIDFSDETRPDAVSPEEWDQRRMNAETVEVPVLTQEQIVTAMKRDRRRKGSP